MPKYLKSLKWLIEDVARMLGYIILKMETTNHLMVTLQSKEDSNFIIKPKGFSTTPTSPLKKDQVRRQILQAQARKMAWDNWRKDPTKYDKPQS
tara:strand:+ start:697 stop:978 length:282 start_codon:yes stop_codon:yes gene_type:complete